MAAIAVALRQAGKELEIEVPGDCFKCLVSEDDIRESRISSHKRGAWRFTPLSNRE